MIHHIMNVLKKIQDYQIAWKKVSCQGNGGGKSLHAFLQGSLHNATHIDH